MGSKRGKWAGADSGRDICTTRACLLSFCCWQSLSGSNCRTTCKCLWFEEYVSTWAAEGILIKISNKMCSLLSQWNWYCLWKNLFLLQHFTDFALTGVLLYNAKWTICSHHFICSFKVQNYLKRLNRMEGLSKMHLS